MAGRSQGFKPGVYTFPLELPADLNLDLHAFCEVHFGASKVEVARRALRRLINSELQDPRIRRQFEDVRAHLAKLGRSQLVVVEAKAASAE